MTVVDARASAPVTHVIQQPPDVLIASSSAQRLAEEAGLSARDCADVCLAVRELAANILTHAGEGTMTLTAQDDELRVEATDHGPGIADVERAVTDGFSTTGGLGYGLGTVNRVMDDLTITSRYRRGTTVVATKQVRHFAAPGTHSPYEVGVATLPKAGFDDNGDSYVVRTGDTQVLVGVIDGVGHGAQAQVAAQTARRYIESHFDQPMPAIFRGTDTACRGTRGVVLALARLDWAAGTIEFASVGNIETRVIDGGVRLNFVVRRGIVGVNAPPPKVTVHPWPPGATLIMHSDGIHTRWGPGAMDGLEQASAPVVARTILSRQNRHCDDATVLVVKRASS